MSLTFEQLKEIIDGLAASNKELQASLRDTERMVKQNQKQLGELGNKFGSFAEGLAYPSVVRIMMQEFGMDGVDQIMRRKGAETLEIDALGSANGKSNRVIVGEIKSHFREEHIEQIEKICEKLLQFMPEHQGKTINGMFIFVKGEKNAIQKAANRGLIAVQASDENFKLRSPKNFVARDFSK